MIQRRKPLRRTPIRKRRSKPRRGRERDPKYLAWIASLPCFLCGIWPVEVAHLGDRGLSQKCHDRETGPLCHNDHQAGKYALHRLGKRFWEHHGIDKAELIAEYNRRYDTLAAEMLVRAEESLLSVD